MTTWEKVFISYSSKDRERIQPIIDALSRIFETYIAEDDGKGGEELNNKIRENIEDSNVIIPFLTKRSISSQWVNQEIGYAHCFSIKNSNEPLILPVREEGLNISGFVHENIEYVPLYYDDHRKTAYQLIKRLREYINRNWTTITEVNIKCPKCDYEFKIELPSQEEIDNAVRSNKFIPVSCKRCEEEILLDPRTFEVAKHHSVVRT